MKDNLCCRQNSRPPGVDTLLSFNLKHTRKELPLETARKTHEIQHGSLAHYTSFKTQTLIQLPYNERGSIEHINELPWHI